MDDTRKTRAKEHREKAKMLLVHYFALALPSADSDMRDELGEIVDHIIDAAVLEAAIAIHP